MVDLPRQTPTCSVYGLMVIGTLVDETQIELEAAVIVVNAFPNFRV